MYDYVYYFELQDRMHCFGLHLFGATTLWAGGINYYELRDVGSAPNISFLNEYGTEIGWMEGLEASNHLVVYGLRAFFSGGNFIAGV